jgi:hypothetical protein
LIVGASIETRESRIRKLIEFASFCWISLSIGQVVMTYTPIWNLFFEVALRGRAH